MKIKLWSDLHFEFKEHMFDHIWDDNNDMSDVTLLLAGDIDLGSSNTEFIESVCGKFKHVLRICGNHEFYHNDFSKVIADWTEYELGGPDNFHFLHNDSRILDGVRFIGGTMWTSFDNSNPMVMSYAQRKMNDYSEIKCAGKCITPAFIHAQHMDFLDYTFKTLDEPFDGPTVVMTHHSPGNIIKRRGRIGDLLDHCYYADLEGIIGNSNNAPKLWVHGHTHSNADYMINETRVVCNPYGYWSYAENKDFDRDIILEV